MIARPRGQLVAGRGRTTLQRASGEVENHGRSAAARPNDGTAAGWGPARAKRFERRAMGQHGVTGGGPHGAAAQLGLMSSRMSTATRGDAWRMAPPMARASGTARSPSAETRASGR